MNPRSLWALLGLIAVLLAPARSHGKMVDGRAVLDTPHHVSLLVPASVDLVRLAIPTATVTSIIKGDTLVGTNIKPPQLVTLGVPGRATLKVDWEYKAIKMADGSGTAILLDVSAVPEVAGQMAPLSATYIVMPPSEVAQKFKDCNAVISAVLYSMYFVYYNGGAGYVGFGGGYAFSMLPYSTWYTFNPSASDVTIGPTIYIGWRY
ncbi:MAG TPA: hypothetical protein VHN79_04460 [Lacunisphaera sp.]|nr:hypothetical protein [Lacunisphaera sp.]